MDFLPNIRGQAIILNVVSVSRIKSRLPEFENRWQLITADQSVNDIIKEMLRAHTLFADHYDLIAAEFYGGDVLEKLFQFCKKNFPYRIESDKVQTSRSALAVLKLGEGGKYGLDCKHYAQFIGGVLGALNRSGLGNFKWCYRFACYDDTRSPDHVFIVVKERGGEVWIDPTPIQNGSRFLERAFDDRRLLPTYYKDKTVKDMALYRVSGVSTLGPINPHTNNSVGKRKVSGLVETALDAAAKVAGLLPPGPLKNFVTAIANDPVGAILKLLTGRVYTKGNYTLGEVYMRNILGMAEIQSNGQVPDGMVVQAWMFFTTALGTRVHSSDDLTALGTSAQTYLTRPGSIGLQADPAQAERAFKSLRQFGYPESASDGRRNTPWQISLFASTPYIGRMPGPDAGTWYTGPHPVTGENYTDGYITTGGSGMTQGGGTGSGNDVPPGGGSGSPAAPTATNWGKVALITGGVGLVSYAIYNAASKKKN